MTARHRNGQFAHKPVRDAAPMLLVSPKCARVSKGNYTKAANQRAKVRAVAEALDAEVRAAKYARSTLGILERHNGVGAEWLGVFL